MQIKEIIDALERFAPLPLQDGFDNAGLQIGLTAVEATGALLCLDVTEDVIREAVAEGCNLVVSHHPLLFKGVKSITGSTYVERCIVEAIKHDVTIYSAHTNLDNAQGGVNYKIAEKLGMRVSAVLDPHPDGVTGSGVVGELDEPISEEQLLSRLKERFSVACVRHNELTGRQIRRIALCGGAGAFLLPKAIEQGADAFITGEIRYHEYFGHPEVLMAEIGHYESEQYTIDILRDVVARAANEAGASVKIVKTGINTNPIKYY
jgi:dinuclear metal center YbgI/SA1388 family protein